MCDSPPQVLPEVVYVPKVVEKKVMVQCRIKEVTCDVLSGGIDEQLFTSIKCITDLKAYINQCNRK